MREIILAIVGIIIGVIGLMFGSKKSQQVKDLKEEKAYLSYQLDKQSEQIKNTVDEVKTTKEEVKAIKEERDEKKPASDTVGSKLDRLRK